MLFGRKTKQADKIEHNQPIEKPAEQENEPIVTEETIEPQETETIKAESEHQPEPELPQEEDQDMRESDLTASISRDTVINGDIQSQDNIDVFGTVEGSIKCSAVVKVYGKVNGDIHCSVLVANGAAIVGNIESENSVVLGNDTTVKGDIQTGVMNISGQVNGNITAVESTAISNSGSVYGDISTPVIEVSKGAIVFGSVIMEKTEEKLSDKPSKKNGKSDNKKKTTVTELSFTELPKEKSAESNMA